MISGGPLNLKGATQCYTPIMFPSVITPCVCECGNGIVCIRPLLDANFCVAFVTKNCSNHTVNGVKFRTNFVIRI